jgi:hypothetical protein
MRGGECAGESAARAQTDAQGKLAVDRMVFLKRKPPAGVARGGSRGCWRTGYRNAVPSPRVAQSVLLDRGPLQTTNALAFVPGVR